MAADIQLSPAQWLWRVQAARRNGEYLGVIDLTRQALEQCPGDLKLLYERILAQARSGATAEAGTNLRALQDAGSLAAVTDPALHMDFQALAARLLKDRAYAASEPDAAPLAHAAAAAYEAVFAETGAYFPAINAATLHRIAGDMEPGQRLAETALALARADQPGFWRDATIAEAQLLLGDVAAAKTALDTAVASGVHLDELATTRRQLAWLCRHLPAGSAALASLPAPYLLCWTSPGAHEPPLVPIAALIAEHSAAGLPVLAYGAILGLGDVGVAECLLAAGAHVNLVLASTVASCVAEFTTRFGPGCGERLQAVLDRAFYIAEVTLEGGSDEPVVAAMAAQQASGLAAMRAAALVTTVHPLDAGLMANSISPSRPSRERVGVRALHGSSPELAASHPHPALLPRAGEGEKAVGRIARAFVFGDIKGFSTITEAEHRPFLDHIIGGFADVVDRLREHVEYTETAGDGVYIVLSDVIAALRCCHGFQTAMDPAGLAAAGLPATLGLRLGAHAGPVARGVDRVIAREKFIGKEVIRTARIEAVTPVGQTYVTEQFAATLHAVSPVGHACEYVGLQAMAKGFGYCRMYSLRPTPQILALLDS